MLTGLQWRLVMNHVVEDVEEVAHAAHVIDVINQNSAAAALHQAVALSAKDFLEKSPQKIVLN